MAKLSSVQKNLFRQKLIKKYKSKRETLKSQIKNKNLSLEERISFQKAGDLIQLKTSTFRLSTTIELEN